jgi:asparagine synthase (glutamine-hydrolysing)
LARDRLGIKPLFYAPIKDGLAFASELKSLLCLPEIDRRLSWNAVGHLMTFLPTPATESILDGVRKLDAGQRAVLKPGRPLAVERYWDVEFEADLETGEDELTGRLRETIDEAVRLHLRSDVPLGAFLSGGVDSTAVVAAMSRLTSQPIKTFSIGFADQAFDESPYARQAAQALGTEHHELILEPQKLDVIDDIVWHLDEPLGDNSAIPTYAVSAMAAEHVKVVLTGDGGDELFGGYDKYVVEARERRYDRLPLVAKRTLGRLGSLLPHGMPGQRLLSHFALAGPRRYLDASTLFPARERAKLFTPEAREQIGGGDPLAPGLETLDGFETRGLAALQYCDLRGYLPLDILVKVDRMTMAHSLEARPVLLDHHVVECAARMPPGTQIRGETTKYLFKRAVGDLLPPGIANRRKQGFGMPLARWFRGPWTDFVGDVLLSERSRNRGIFNASYVEHLLRLNRRGRSMDRELWTLVTFEQWCRLFVDRTPSRPVSRRMARMPMEKTA